jgi:hypothetical protein
LQNVVRGEVPKNVNKIFVLDQGSFQIFPGISIDFSIPYTPVMDNNLLDFGIKG